MDLSWRNEATALRRGAEELGPSLNESLVERDRAGVFDRDCISHRDRYDGVDALAPGDPLLAGALDSVDVLRLVVFVEERYAVTIEDEDLVPENFATVSALAELLRWRGAG